MVKCLPAMRETWVRSLGWEDPLEKEMAAHSSILAWKIPWMEEPGRLQSMGSQRVGHDLMTSLSLSFFFFFPIFFKFNFIFKLYNIVLGLPSIEMNQPQVYMCSPS